jgi:hypothetical protein
METIAEKRTTSGRLIRYILKHDDKGYYFDGAQCASYRRKQRRTVEDSMSRHGFDIYETE